MKTFVVNASPRKHWNTARILHAAAEGAKAAGAEVQGADLYDIDFHGCRSCMLCKRLGAEPCRCCWKDGLSPILEQVYAADTLLIGTPIYFGRPTSAYFAFLERLRFPALSYDDYGNLFKGRVNVGLFVTMNAKKDMYDKLYAADFAAYADEFRFLNGEVRLYPVSDTLQVTDYTKFAMRGFSEAEKKKANAERFPADLQNAYQLGAALSRRAAP